MNSHTHRDGALQLSGILARYVMCAALLIRARADATAQSATQRTRLANGLTVVMRPIAGARTACVVVLYRIGGDHDPLGRSGLGHRIEHVYVTAAAGDRKARAVEEFVRAYPAGWEAQTGSDYTIFATVFPRANLESEVREAADRMGRLRVTASDLEREKPRLIAEVGNMFGGLPTLAAWNLARERVRPTLAQGRRGGVPEQVKRISAAEAQARWKRFYIPRNAILVVTGDCDPAAARAAITGAFAAVPPGKTAPIPPAPAGSRTGARERIAVKPLTASASSEVCLMAAAPSPADAQYPAFLVFVARLQMHALEIANGPAPALAQRLPPPVYYALLNDPGCLSLSAAVKQGETPESVTARLNRLTSADLHRAAETWLAERRWATIVVVPK